MSFRLHWLEKCSDWSRGRKNVHPDLSKPNDLWEAGGALFSSVPWLGKWARQKSCVGDYTWGWPLRVECGVHYNLACTLHVNKPTWNKVSFSIQQCSFVDLHGPNIISSSKMLLAIFSLERVIHKIHFWRIHKCGYISRCNLKYTMRDFFEMIFWHVEAD